MSLLYPCCVCTAKSLWPPPQNSHFPGILVPIPLEFSSPFPWNSHPHFPVIPTSLEFPSPSPGIPIPPEFPSRCPGAVPAHPSRSLGQLPGAVTSPGAPKPLCGCSPAACLCRGWRSIQLTRLNPRGEGIEKEFGRGRSAWAMLGSARCYATPCGNHGNGRQRRRCPFLGHQTGIRDPGGFSTPP